MLLRRIRGAGHLHGPVEAFDLTGKDLGPASIKDVMPSSPSGQYVRSLQEDGTEAWEVYSAATLAPLLKFYCDQPECKQGDYNEEETEIWNPKFSNQIVALGSDDKYDGVCDIYQLSPPRLVKTVPCGGLPAYDWSRDGRELVTLQDESNLFSSEPVN